ncbi:MAG: DUF4132 domain-containing protein [Chloroflexi bacterium]|nr:DUF4132 domain-containing protein [Chloroflexota bacterium]
MLTPEQVRELTRKHINPQWEEQLVTRLGKLPDKPVSKKLAAKASPTTNTELLSLRQIAYLLGGFRIDGSKLRLGQHPYVEPERQRKHYDQVERATALFYALEPAGRRAIFAAMFSKNAAAFETLWHFVPTLTYQVGYARRSFRAPGHPEVSRSRQVVLLQSYMGILNQYNEDLLWFAQHAGYLNWQADLLGLLFAAQISAGSPLGARIKVILIQSANGEHPIGIMGRHVTRALLTANDPAGWEFCEKLLIAAQRAEGMRQTILEAVDEAHPEAFRRMLRLILDHDLVRFPAVIRAADVWFGFAWDADNARGVHHLLRTALDFLDDADACAEALRGGDGSAVYLALWAIAYQDVYAAIEAAQPLIVDPDVERRYAALILVGQTQLADNQPLIAKALADDDLRVALQAVYFVDPLHMTDLGVFEKIAALLSRVPKDGELLPPIVWEWQILRVRRHAIEDAFLRALRDRSPKVVIPYLPLLTKARAFAARIVARLGLDDPDARPVLFDMIADREHSTREQILKLFEETTICPEEAPELETLLTRKTAGLRRGVLHLLTNMPVEAVLASAIRLTAARTLEQRLAGLELLKMLHESGRGGSAPRERAREYRDRYHERTDGEDHLLDALIAEEAEAATLKDGLGTFNPADQTSGTAPKARKVRPVTPAASALITALDDLVHAYRHTLTPVPNALPPRDEPFGNVSPIYPSADQPARDQLEKLPLAEGWTEWAEARPPKLRDPDGLELIRAYYEAVRMQRRWQMRHYALQQSGEMDLALPRYRHHVMSILYWLIRLYPAHGAETFIVDLIETACAQFEPEHLKNFGAFDSPLSTSPSPAGQEVRLLLRDLPTKFMLPEFTWTDEAVRRLWRLLRWIDRPTEESPRRRPALIFAVAAHRIGAATDADILDILIGERDQPRPTGYFLEAGFDDLAIHTRRTPNRLLREYPALAALVERARDRVVEVELRRGEMPTDATQPAQAISSIPGNRWFVRILGAIGKDGITREYTNASRIAVLSRLLRITYPLESDTAEAFTEAVRSARLREAALMEAAVFAPQWAHFVEAALGWEGFTEAVFWLHAHTKDGRWFISQELRELWNAEIAQRTPLKSQDLLDGAVDVDWFGRVYTRIGAARWKKLYDAAKYSSGGIGHARAKLFSDAMLNQVDQEALAKRMIDKRHQDSARALGLLPLDPARHDQQVTERYQLLQEFLRTGKKGGSQRKIGEKRAFDIGLENLARTAGYADPVRLAWAMEARSAADFVDGRITASVQDVTLTLTIDPVGKPDLTITRAGKALKSVPAKLTKAPEVVAMRDRLADISRQHSRMRASLEEAMNRADRFTVGELRRLLAHPVLAPMLENVVFIGDGVIGYPVEGGAALQHHSGGVTAVTVNDSLSIAHAYDLYQTGEWHLWQRECFIAERIQPFKQVFRELYLLTESERAESNRSRRYAGQQVQPRQAIMLLGGRGWSAHQDFGVTKTIHHEGITAHIGFMDGYFTPAEIDGLTLETVSFTRKGEWDTIPLESISSVAFSEIMRDLDLVVSVAHRGGVDPEASASTVEMRTTLLREALALLKIENVRIQKSHALINGTIGDYSVHLGSAVVHRQPGGALCIIPVHAQHRGRLFLPFADNDPKTAEVVSKVILLARDSQIKDPTILEQLYASV